MMENLRNLSLEAEESEKALHERVDDDDKLRFTTYLCVGRGGADGKTYTFKGETDQVAPPPMGEYTLMTKFSRAPLANQKACPR